MRVIVNVKQRNEQEGDYKAQMVLCALSSVAILWRVKVLPSTSLKHTKCQIRNCFIVKFMPSLRSGQALNIAERFHAMIL